MAREQRVTGAPSKVELRAERAADPCEGAGPASAAPPCGLQRFGLEAAWAADAPPGPLSAVPPSLAQQSAYAPVTGPTGSIGSANRVWASCVRRESQEVAAAPDPVDKAARDALAGCLREETAVYVVLGAQAPGTADRLMRELQATAEKTATREIAQARQGRPAAPSKARLGPG
jgi:hypothetical protein